MWCRYIQKEKRTMAVTAMMGTSEYIRVVSTGGLAVTGLFVATATQRDKMLLFLIQFIKSRTTRLLQVQIILDPISNQEVLLGICVCLLSGL